MVINNYLIDSKALSLFESMVQEKIAAVVEVQCRIGQAAAVFASLKWCLWKKANTTIATKVHLFRSLIIQILLYGSETWTLLNMENNKLENFHSEAMPQANLERIPAPEWNCMSTVRQPAHDRRGNTEKTLTVVWARVPNRHCSTAIQTTLAPMTTNVESTPQCTKDDLSETSRRQP